MKTYVKHGLSLAALGLIVLASAQPADAARHKAKHLVKGQPVQVPVLDYNLAADSVENQFAMMQTRVPGAQALSQGAGIKVAVVDGGFDLTHDYLVGHMLPGWDFVGNDGNPQDTGNLLDDDLDGVTDSLVGHGTFVSGLIATIAPQAQIMPIRVLDDESWGTPEAVAMGINYAVSHGCKVINMSLVIPDAPHVLRDALRDAANQGVLVVGAAGNDPDLWRDDPNIAGKVLAVGAVDATDTLCIWSCTGFLVDTYAPGNLVIGPLGGAVPNSYAYWSGTSFAAPFVSGGAALILSVQPSLSPADLTTRLSTTVDAAFGISPINRGRINLERAITQQP